jgi:hypothetical protein
MTKRQPRHWQRYVAVAFTSPSGSELENPFQFPSSGGPDINLANSGPSQTNLPSAHTEVFCHYLYRPMRLETLQTFQHPRGDTDDNLRRTASGDTQTNLPCSGPCLDPLAALAAAIDRNTKMMELVASHIMHGNNGAPAMPSSTPQGPTQDSDDETAPVIRKSTRMFRRRARPTEHKDVNELFHRVSLILSNEVSFVA